MFTPFPTSSPFRVSVPLTPRGDLCSRASMNCLGSSRGSSPSSSRDLDRESPSLGTWWCWGSALSLPVLPGRTELPLGFCRKLLWGWLQFVPVFPPHARFHSQLQQCVTSRLRAKHHPTADKLQLCHNKHEWLWQCWNVKSRRFSNLPEWICCQFSLCQWVFYVFSVFCTFSLEGGSRFSLMLNIYFLFWEVEIELCLFSTLQGTDLWCTLKTLVLPEILYSVLILLLVIINIIFYLGVL